MSEHSDPFTVDIISNSFPLSTENEVSDPFEHLELSPSKRYALWRKDTVEYWNPWWRQVLSSSKTDGKFGYFQGANIQNGSPSTLCKACWMVFAYPELRTGSSSASTLQHHAEHKKYGGSKTGQGLLSQFGAGTIVSE